METISYKRLVYESVNEGSLYLRLYLKKKKSTENRIQVVKGGFCTEY